MCAITVKERGWQAGRQAGGGGGWWSAMGGRRQRNGGLLIDRLVLPNLEYKMKNVRATWWSNSESNAAWQLVIPWRFDWSNGVVAGEALSGTDYVLAITLPAETWTVLYSGWMWRVIQPASCRLSVAVPPPPGTPRRHFAQKKAINFTFGFLQMRSQSKKVKSPSEDTATLEARWKNAITHFRCASEWKTSLLWVEWNQKYYLELLRLAKKWILSLSRDFALRNE